MKPSFDGVDLMAAIGSCATILAGSVFFLSANGMIGPWTADSPAEATGTRSEMEFVQSALGQAIVDSVLLDLTNGRDVAVAAAQLNRTTMLQYGMDGSIDAYLQPVNTWAALREADHAARVEMVKGRAIVNFTRRGVRHGWLSADQYLNQYNDRLIRQVESTGIRMEEEFSSTWQPNLGEAIVGASLAHTKLVDQIQEGIGASVVRVAQAQSGYEEANGSIQTQLGALTNAVIRTELQGEPFPGQPVGETVASSIAEVSGMRTLPEVSFGHVIMASIGLLGLLIAGFILSGRPETPEAVSRTRFEPVEQRTYRRTA
jgi:hypothetical protein